MDPRITLKAAFDLFILEGKSRRLTPRTIETYHERFRPIFAFFAEQQLEYLDQLTHHHLRAFLVQQQARKISSAYLHGFARGLRAWLNYCVRDELIAVSPFAKVQMPRLEKKVLEAVSTADVKRLLKACKNERDRAFLLFMLDTGVRAFEVCAINVGDVDLGEGDVMIRLGKGQKGRQVHIGPHTRKAILRYFVRERGGQPEAKEPLFMTLDDHIRTEPVRISYHTIKMIIRRLRKDTGIKFSAHAIRRTFAINCLRNGMDIYTLARLMGHADITVLRHYLPLVNSDTKAAHAKYSVVDNL